MGARERQAKSQEPLPLHPMQTTFTWKLFVIPVVVVALLVGAILAVQRHDGGHLQRS